LTVLSYRFATQQDQFDEFDLDDFLFWIDRARELAKWMKDAKSKPATEND
jgi:hypothetical protein